MKQWHGYQVTALVSGAVVLSLLLFAVLYGDWPHFVFIVPLLLLQIRLSRKQALPMEFFFLFPLIALLATLGSKHTLNLYGKVDIFDKVVHILTAFVITYFISFTIRYTPIQYLTKHRFFLFSVIFSFGLAVGVFWEIFEWVSSFFMVVNLNESIDDVITDLIIDALGAALASLFIVLQREKA